MADLFHGCRIDDAASNELSKWREELQTLDIAIKNQIASAATEIAKLTASSKEAATLILAGTGDRVKITSKTPGAEYNGWTFFLNPSFPGEPQFVRTIVPGNGDTFNQITRALHLDNGDFTSADVGRVFRYSASLRNVANNGDYTIESVSSATDIVVVETPSSDDGVIVGVGDGLIPSSGHMLLSDTGNLFLSTMVGQWVRITGSSNPINDGTFSITEYLSSSILGYDNPAGVYQEFYYGTWQVTMPFLNGTTDGVYSRSYLSVDVDEVNRLVIIYLAIETVGANIGNVLSTAQDVVNLFSSDASLSALFSAELLDGSTGIMAYELQQLENGHSASVTSVSNALNALFTKRGATYREMLSNVGVPTFTSNSQVLADTTGVVAISTGKTWLVQGTNLEEIRTLWNLTDQDSTQLLSWLAFVDGAPIVVWTKTVTNTLSAEACQREEDVVTETDEVVAVNSKPNDSDATPNIWWITEIDGKFKNLLTLQQYGLTSAQIADALFEDTEWVHVIPEKSVFNDLVSSEVTEILSLSAEGILPIAFHDALRNGAETPASPSTGYMSPMLNFPPDKLRDELSPSSDLASQIDDSPCIDPLAKSGLIGVISAVSSMIDVMSGTVSSVTSVASGVINTLGEIVGAINTFFSGVSAEAGCFGGFSISFDGPQIEVLSLELPFLSLSVDFTFDLIIGAFESLNQVVCKIRKALLSLIFVPGSSLLTCLAKGLTNDLINAFGIDLNLEICIVNPLDYLGMIDDLIEKINGIVSLVNAVLRDLTFLQAQIQALATAEFSPPFKESVADCDSAALDALIGRVKLVLGVG